MKLQNCVAIYQNKIVQRDVPLISKATWVPIENLSCTEIRAEILFPFVELQSLVLFRFFFWRDNNNKHFRMYWSWWKRHRHFFDILKFYTWIPKHYLWILLLMNLWAKYRTKLYSLYFPFKRNDLIFSGEKQDFQLIILLKQKSHPNICSIHFVNIWLKKHH